MSHRDMNAAHALASAIASAKRMDGRPMREQYAGRVDRTRLSRLACGDRRIFLQPVAPSPKRLRLYIVLDASSSMMVGGRERQANQLSRDMVEACAILPNVSAQVWAHTTPYHEVDRTTNASVYHLWSTGQPTSKVDKYLRLSFSGNKDSVALAYIGEQLVHDLRPGEQGLIVMVSDGQPVITWDMEAGVQHVGAVAKSLRRQGVPTVSVSIAGDLRLSDQIKMYGRDLTVQYTPNHRALANNMAKAIGHAMR